MGFWNGIAPAIWIGTIIPQLMLSLGYYGNPGLLACAIINSSIAIFFNKARKAIQNTNRPLLDDHWYPHKEAKTRKLE